jgi:hypothetical protein
MSCSPEAPGCLHDVSLVLLVNQDKISPKEPGLWRDVAIHLLVNHPNQHIFLGELISYFTDATKKMIDELTLSSSSSTDDGGTMILHSDEGKMILDMIRTHTRLKYDDDTGTVSLSMIRDWYGPRPTYTLHSPILPALKMWASREHKHYESKNWFRTAMKQFVQFAIKPEISKNGLKKVIERYIPHELERLTEQFEDDYDDYHSSMDLTGTALEDHILNKDTPDSELLIRVMTCLEEDEKSMEKGLTRFLASRGSDELKMILDSSSSNGTAAAAGGTKKNAVLTLEPPTDSDMKQLLVKGHCVSITPLPEPLPLAWRTKIAELLVTKLGRVGIREYVDFDTYITALFYPEIPITPISNIIASYTGI